MKKLVLLFFVLFVNLSVWAELRDGHFFKTLQSQNLTEEDAVAFLNQWFTLPQETEWRRIGERTDNLGMTRVEYRQYVSGVEVEHSQVLLHLKDGRVQTANGTVMEVRQMPAKVRRYSNVYRDGTPTDLLGRKLYMVNTKNGYRYATKVLSADRSEWIYTDAETGELLKRIPTRYRLTAEPVKVTGRSIYSGEVQMDAYKDTVSNTYKLMDQKRNIHTLIGATIPSIEAVIDSCSVVDNFPQFEGTFPAPEEEMTDEMWQEWLESYWDWNALDFSSYVKRNAIYASSAEPYFDSYIINTITIDRIAYADDDWNPVELMPTEDNPCTLYTKIQYKDKDGVLDNIETTVTGFPITIDLKKYLDEIPTEGINVFFSAVMDNKISKEDTNEDGENNEQKWLNLPSFWLIPEESDNGRVDYADEWGNFSITFEKGPWSAVDIHWGMQKTYDFYKNTFGRDSYDGNGAPIYNLFYLPDGECSSTYFFEITPNNASAICGKYMMYGMGSRNAFISGLLPVVELSIMSHEYTHMVTESTANLVYQGESGAANESFSDIMAISVKKDLLGNDASWTVGNGVIVGYSNIRSMQDPKASMDGNRPCSDTYKGEFWVDADSDKDYGGVHTNSGVQNKWYYLLTDGGSGTNDNGYSYQLDGIGISKSQQIAYRTLVEYATEEAQYADIRLASIQAAKDLYGDNSKEALAVDGAWKGVGVGVDVDPTAIRNIETTDDEHQTLNHSVYDLAGRKVQNPQKGLYIVNGKKYIKN